MLHTSTPPTKDGSNKSAVMEAADHWGKTQAAAGKIRLMTEYCRKHDNVKSVPDPYYGGADGFERVLDLLEDACEGLLESMK
jgi:protein-tyrosine phosphatase